MEKREAWLIVIFFLVLFGWTGFRMCYSYSLGEPNWFIPWSGVHFPGDVSVAAEVCEPSYGESWFLGGLYAPVNDQSWEFQVGICTVGCYERFGVMSNRLEAITSRDRICHCDLNDCSPKEFPEWY